jgi:arsenate reductase
MKTKVLFLCTGNSCRSQMAEGFLRHLAGDDFEAHSAGTHPSHVHPIAVAVMLEKGIDISKQRSKNVRSFIPQHIHWAITVCDNAARACPMFRGECQRAHWPLRDPALAAGTREKRLTVFREVRDEIENHVRAFIAGGDRAIDGEA